MSLETYAEQPTIRGLVELAKSIPGAGSLVAVFDASVLASLEKYREKQFAAFLDEIARNGLDPQEPIPEDKQFDVVRAVLITTEAVAKSHREEKTRAFGRLLAAGLQEPPLIVLSDEFEDYVSILDDVTFRELEVLALLAQYEGPFRNVQSELDYEIVSTYWPDFIQELTTTLGILPSETLGLLARLNRTGLYSTLLESLWGGIGIAGNLTGSYYRLAEMIGSKQPMSQ